MNRYSPSKLKTYSQCRLKFKLHYLDDVREVEPITSDTLFGKLFHKMAEIYDGSNKPELVKLVKKYQPLDAAYMALIAPSLQNFFRFWDKYQKYPASTEKEYEWKSPNGLWMYGIIDRIITKPNGEHLVVDYKTARTPAADGHRFQLRFYNLMVSKLNAIPPETVRCMIYYPRIHHEDKAMFMTKEIALFEQELGNTVAGIEANSDWPASPGFHCKWCAYKNTRHCPETCGTYGGRN